MVDAGPDSSLLADLMETRTSARTLRADGVPALPGAYVWFNGPEVFFIGSARDLRERIYERHIARVETARSSALRRVVAQHLGYGRTADFRGGRQALSEAQQ